MRTLPVSLVYKKSFWGLINTLLKKAFVSNVGLICDGDIWGTVVLILLLLGK